MSFLASIISGGYATTPETKSEEDKLTAGSWALGLFGLILIGIIALIVTATLQ